MKCPVCGNSMGLVACGDDPGSDRPTDQHACNVYFCIVDQIVARVNVWDHPGTVFVYPDTPPTTT